MLKELILKIYESSSKSIDLYKTTDDKGETGEKVKTFSSVPSADTVASLLDIDTGSEDFQVLTEFLAEVKDWYDKGCKGESPEVGPIGKDDIVIYFK